MPVTIALMAHVDAGKTTLTERMLYETGAIRVLGSVDEGTARTDDLSIEKARGISIRAACTSLMVGDTAVNIIDTPGHTDFYSQAERAFWAVDAVVVLVSAVDGIQSGTETLIAEAAQSRVPVIFFINKCDRELAQKEECIAQIKAAVNGAFDYTAEAYETAALYDDSLMTSFLEDAPEDTDAINRVLSRRFAGCEISPILTGSAQTGDGVMRLLEVICRLATPDSAESEPFAGIVFSVQHDKLYGRGAYVRVYSGVLRVRDAIGTDKVGILRKPSRGRWLDEKELRAGDVGLVYGLSDCRTDDVLGDRSLLPPRAGRGFHKKALLTAQVTAKNLGDTTALKNALEMMTAEDPTLELDADSDSIHIHVMGSIQMETLPSLLEERFGLTASLGEPEVIYKETLAQPAIGFDAYTMPKPCWAVLKFLLTPSPRGSGITYRCTAGANRLPYRYREQVEQTIVPALKQGLYGWEVTDIDIELIDGEDHHVHTHPLDFTVATPLALFDGLRNGGTVLLEPVMDVKLTFQEKHLGRVISDVVRMRGKVESQAFHRNNVTLTSQLPFADALDYPVTFASLTSGKGLMTQKLREYRECPLELGKTRARKGVDPLNRAKFILAARNAISG